MTYGNTSFLFTGDAEELSEQEILNSGVNIKSDVLKVGHHGSSSSTTPEFLQAVSPKYAVISYETNNDYGHPHSETLEKLNGITTYKTAVDGNIVFTSDGTTISVETNVPVLEKQPQQSEVKSNTETSTKVENIAPPTTNNDDKSVTVYITNTGAKYHSSGCRYLRKSKIATTLGEAISSGYTPCSKCSPPR